MMTTKVISDPIASEKTLLITGVAGFLAQAVIALASADWRIIGLGRKPTTLTAGICDYHDSVESVISSRHRIDAVLHTAAVIPRAFSSHPPGLIETNIILPARIVAAFPNARHVLASSVAVYGNQGAAVIDVDSLPKAEHAYGLSKVAAESIMRMTESYAILRLTSIIGVGMRREAFIPTAVAAARAGQITLFGDGSRLQDYLDVRDAALQCLAALERHDSFTTLAVSGKSYSNIQVATVLAKLTGAGINFVGTDPSPSSTYSRKGSVELAPLCYELDDTLSAMVNEQ